MGLLSKGRPLNWDETKRYSRHVRDVGVAQFVNVYNASKNRADGPFKWGDEIEYILVKFDHLKRSAKVNLKAETVFNRIEEMQRASGMPAQSIWHPEYASYMVEGTPSRPYGMDGNLLNGLCEIEASMNFRRLEVSRALDKDETMLSLTNFPRLGCPDFTAPETHPRPLESASKSEYFPDECIFQGHPRFEVLTRNILARRGRKLEINVPVYKDLRTQDPNLCEQYAIDPSSNKLRKPGHIFMDACGFGMGCCCLQITLQASQLQEAKMLYDQLVPLAPIAFALGAASPIYRGKLAAVDSRWNIISASTDDRTREESGDTSRLKESKFRIPKPRYGSVSLYISKQGEAFNDLPLVMDEQYYDYMVSNGVEQSVARHIAHLFIREPIALYKEKLDQTVHETDHFENIQSTNWQTIRFKPPPSENSPIGWRVEFRPFDAQITDFENAAFTVFIILLTRVILAYKLNFLLPLSLVDENIENALKMDAISEQKFWFRYDIVQKSIPKNPLSTVLENCSNTNTCKSPTFCDPNQSRPDVRSYAAKMSINQIINGCQCFIGLVPIVNHYVDSLNDGSNQEQIDMIDRYLRLVSERASLKIKTTARFLRDFVISHPAYRQDSEVSDEINYDLIKLADRIAKGELRPSELLGTDESPHSACAGSRKFCMRCRLRQTREAAAKHQDFGYRSNQTAN